MPNVAVECAAHALRASGVVGLVGLMVVGCATPQHRQATQDWQTICANTPLVPGSTISAAEQHAMTRQEAWSLSVKEVNARCLSLK